MAREQTTDKVQEELEHIPPGEAPQEALRSAYRELRSKSPAEERSAVFHDALMSVYKSHPGHRFRYDGSYFRHT